MNNSGIKKSHTRILIILLLVTITAGAIFMFSMLGKSQEERRNREYEVSLVNSLKNSYQGIEEIKISNPEYKSPPGSWSCDVEIKFKHEEKIKYGVGYSLDTEEITDTSLEWENRVKDRQFLNENKGKTASKIKVTYSNNDEGEQ
ncbi:hypothetical protein [Streptococcus oralis]|uniref:DUF1433 domain-containing protein n=2 Tax=Streptococcus oralis TaxID=1303 RepID=A0AAW7W6B7_STROR|nr:hypothetical protein [Streptococcus oralis]MDB6218763.1 hypothetical protein [Streptococcus oralis]MDO6343206.1 hypothetical protein [Streptococcus oralis]MDO6347184.1 hypothetical protein [Streptococcus oralis]MDO6349142.1 hypothetical protein [Streptococcus oralis]MDU3459551.1 hypothetical protein [Streptococcus oralis]